MDGNPVVETGTDSNGGNAVTRSWEYDTSGHVKKAISGGFCYTYKYRTDGKLVKKSSSGRTLLSCTYFSNGSLASLTDASGKPVYYEYDWRGKLSGVKDENGNTLAQYTHTPGGKLKEIRHGNGMYTQYEYDTDGNIIHLRLERPDGTPLSDWQYEYDLNGNRTLKAGSFADAEVKLCGTVIRYRYDRMDRLTEESYDEEAVRYSYDLCGNRLEKVDKNGKEVYTYNVKNQLTGRKSEKAETCYRYDQQGNVLEATGTEGGVYYSYNAFNQQTRVQKSDGNSLESQYDAEYLRAGTVENGKVCMFSYYNGELLAELNQNQKTVGRYVLGYGVAAGWNYKNDGYHFYHLDEQNSTAYITVMEGGIENRYQFDAFGVIRDHQEKFPNRILYTGQQYDPITEQYYLRIRYYNPTVGRFLQEDVYRGDGLNLYAYCGNNPEVYYDPSGYKSKGLLPNELSPGLYQALLNTFGNPGKTKLTPHHMPSDLYMGTRYGVDTKNGFAMLLETAYRNKGSRHSKTQSYGRPSEAYKAWYLSLSPRDALANDLKDLRRVLQSEGLYDEQARKSIREYLHGWENENGEHVNGILEQTFSSDEELVSDPEFKGKRIEDEAIFSREYEDNRKDKQDDEKPPCQKE